MKGKITELATNSKSKNIRNLYRGRNECKRGYQPRNSLLKDNFKQMEELLFSITECQ
jgi:hypothetical protein